jgi:hypothetical protein
MASDLLIVADLSSVQPSLRPSSFPLRVDGDKLHLPSRMKEMLQRRHIGSARAFLSFLRATPEPLRAEFGWDADSLAAFVDRLVEVLRKHLPDEVLAARPPMHRILGARDPSAEPQSQQLSQGAPDRAGVAPPRR